MSRFIFALLVITTLTICGPAQAAILTYTANGTQGIPAATLATARTQAGIKRVVVTSALSAVQSNISSATNHGWGASDPILDLTAGSIANTTKFDLTGANVILPSNKQCFTGSGAITGLSESRPEWFGANGDGVADDTSKLLAASQALSQGGKLLLNGSFYIGGNITIPTGVIWEGSSISVNQRSDGAYIPSNYASSLIIDPVATITLSSGSGIRNALVLAKVISPIGAYPLPFANATVATNAVAAFSGTAFQPASVSQDTLLENLLVLGFNKLYDGVGAASSNRPVFRRVYGDCTNGIFVSKVYDIGRAEDCHMWPFTTTNQSFTTNALLLRPGTAFYTESGSTWFKWQDCFEYGWATGHDVNGVQDVRQINCGADSSVAGQTALGVTDVGFQYRGSIANAMNIGPIITAQGNAGIILNTTPQNGINDVKIVSGMFHGNNSNNGYINLASGSASIIGSFFADNSGIGHIKLGSGTYLSALGNTFANGGANPAIFGDATAVAAAKVAGNILSGSSSNLGSTELSTQLLTWTPGISFGNLTTGITYAVQLGTYQVMGKLVVASFKIQLSSKGAATGGVKITGLPLTSGNTNGIWGQGAPLYYQNLSGLTGVPVPSVNEASTTATILQTSATNSATTSDANFNNNSIVQGTLIYFAQ